ncbi:MAG: ATP-dependent helicase [Solirubrobacteraceae bacterium]
MPEPLDGLTDAQARAAAFAADGPTALLLHGAAGTGKSVVLAARAAWLCTAAGHEPARTVLLVATPAAVVRSRRRLEGRLGPPAADVVVTTLPDLCHRLLRDAAGETGTDPFVVPATRTERVALLLEHREELGLVHHDGGPAPIPLLAAAVARIDRLKESGVDAGRLGAWADALPPTDRRRAREREFVSLMRLLDRVLHDRGLIDHGDLLLRLLALLDDRTEATRAARDRVRERIGHLLVDDAQDLPIAAVRVIRALTGTGRTDAGGAGTGARSSGLTVAGDDDQAVRRLRGAAGHNLRELAAGDADLRVLTLERSWRGPEQILRAAEAVVAPVADRLAHRWHAPAGGTVRFWRAASERAQAQVVADEVERLLREGTAPERIAVLVHSVRREAGPVMAAMEERALPCRVGGEGAFLQRAEVRDVLAWLRLLLDPADAPAVGRALARPPVELRPADLARVLQIAKRRRTDLVGALAGSTEGGRTLPPEAHDRVATFLRLYRAAVRALDVMPPDQFVHRLIEHLGLRRQQLFGDTGDVVERLRDLASVGRLAERYVRIAPQSTAREFAGWMITLADAGGDPEGRVEAVPFAAGGTGPDGEGLGASAVDGDALPVVRVLPIASAAELEVDHVLVLGLTSSRFGAIGSGAGRRLVDPLPDALLTESLPPDTPAVRSDEARRALHTAMTRARRGVVLAFPAHSSNGAAREPSPAVEDARRTLQAQWEDHDERLFGPDDTLHATFRGLRDELLRDVATIGTRLGDLRMDTDLDVAHGVSRYLELVKVAALINRADGQEVADAMPAIDAAVRQAATAQQKEILSTSDLDDVVLAAATQSAERAAGRREPSLEPFLPLRDEGVVLSAGDLYMYNACPLRYKFARVLRIPQQPTVAQRFGIVVHQVLERWHARGGTEAAELQTLLQHGWRRSGLSGVADEQRLWNRAQDAMQRYHARTMSEDQHPVWLERSFEFRMGPHTVRGRVDRVDRHPDGNHELVDYKTGRPRTPDELRHDVQLQLYAVAAQDAWGLEEPRQSYHYVLDDEKVPVEADGTARDRIAPTVADVGGAILEQDFEPTPSYETCSMCDWRLTCPAAET